MPNTALTRPDLFAAYLAINSALHRNVVYFIELEPAGRERPARLMITRSSEDAEPFRVALDRWLDYWQSAPSDALELSVKPLKGQHHASSAPAAYRAAVEWRATDVNCSGARKD